jgi:hypothetical protein
VLRTLSTQSLVNGFSASKPSTAACAVPSSTQLQLNEAAHDVSALTCRMSVTLESSCSSHTVSVAAPAAAPAAAAVRLVDTATSRHQRHVKERPFNVAATSAGWQHFMPAVLLCRKDAGYVQQQQQVTCLVQVQWWLNKPTAGTSL